MRTALVVTMILVSASAAHGQIAWRSSLAETVTEAQRSGKHVLLHFYSDQCPWCETLEQQVLADPRVAEEIERHFVPFAVDGPRNAKLLSGFRVERYPTEIVMAADGSILAHQVNPATPDAYLAMLHSAALGPTAQDGGSARLAGAAPSANAEGAVCGPEGCEIPPRFPQTDATLAGHRGAPSLTGPANASATSATPQSPGYQPVEQRNRFVDLNVAPNPTAQNEIPSAAAAPPQRATSEASREPVMDGCCLVSTTRLQQWEMGDPRFGAIHLGRLYLFADADAQQEFLAAPHRYALVLDGLDVVKFLDERAVVLGSREWSSHVNEQGVFLFSSEETREQFQANPARYIRRAVELTQQAAAEANPTKR